MSADSSAQQLIPEFDHEVSAVPEGKMLFGTAPWLTTFLAILNNDDKVWRLTKGYTGDVTFFCHRAPGAGDPAQLPQTRPGC